MCADISAPLSFPGNSQWQQTPAVPWQADLFLLFFGNWGMPLALVGWHPLQSRFNFTVFVEALLKQPPARAVPSNYSQNLRDRQENIQIGIRARWRQFYSKLENLAMAPSLTPWSPV